MAFDVLVDSTPRFGCEHIELGSEQVPCDSDSGKSPHHFFYGSVSFAENEMPVFVDKFFGAWGVDN